MICINLTVQEDCPFNDPHTSPEFLQMSPEAQTLLVLALGFMMLSTVVGNVLVCLSVVLVRKLRRPSNYLLISLAVSDLCVAILVMPLALYYELNGTWTFGATLCDLWVSLDVTCCTASILNLCMISVDRYLAITQPLTYGVKRTSKRILLLIIGVWLTSCLISVPPLLIFGNDYGTLSEPQCAYSQNIFYQLYATLGAFYIPLLVMMILYHKIYKAAKKVVDAELKSQVSARTTQNLHCEQIPGLHQEYTSCSDRLDDICDSQSFEDPQMCNVLEMKDMSSRGAEALCSAESLPPSSNGGGSAPRQVMVTYSTRNSMFSSCVKIRHTLWPIKKLSQSQSPCKATLIGTTPAPTKKRGMSGQKRRSFILKERKASITLGVIMTAFIVCWLPFFIMALLRPFRVIPDPPRWLTSFALWLGFANSMLNPIIYVTFHKEFRKAFRYLLCFQCSTMNTKLREQEYYGERNT